MKTPPLSSLIRLTLLCAAFLPAADAGAVLVAGWDFQTGTAINSSGSVQTSYAANFGEGTIWMDGTHGSSAWDPTAGATVLQLSSISGTLVNTANTSFSTTTSGPGGMVLRQPQSAFSSGTSTNGFGMVFEFSMEGCQSLEIDYAYRRNSGGAFNSLTWQYSTDGTAWTTFDTISYSTDDPVSTWTIQSVATLDGLDDQSTAFVRVLVDGATANPSSGREYAIDNLQFNAAAIPEPGALGLAACGFLMASFLRARQRKNFRS